MNRALSGPERNNEVWGAFDGKEDDAKLVAFFETTREALKWKGNRRGFVFRVISRPTVRENR